MRSLISMDLVQQLEFLLRLLLITMIMGSEDKTIPEWYNIKCEKTVEEIAPGFKCVKDAITGEVLAFIHEELDDDMLDEQPSNNT